MDIDCRPLAQSDRRENVAWQEQAPGSLWSEAPALSGLPERADGDAAAFARSLAELLLSADTKQRVAIYRGLALFPVSEALVALATDAVISGARPVFEAVAYNNPFPAMHFSDAVWNQMVIRAVRHGGSLASIQQLDERRNADLAHMLMAIVRKQWVARRGISPELLRCVGPFASEDYFADLKKAFRSGGGDQRKAAALALAECPKPEALIVLETAPTLWRDIRSGRLSWSDIA